MKIIKYIPNTLTSLNLASGCFSIVLSFDGDYFYAAILVLIASVFDFFDGFAARLFKSYSPIGKELDSLADDVSFGVAPGMMVYCVMSGICIAQGLPSVLAWGAFLIPVFSALRLAKFNIDERQATSFIGMPTPANAIFWVFLLSAVNDSLYDLAYSPVYILIAVIVFSLLLVSEIPMFSLKFKHYSWKGNEVRYIFLLVSVILLAVFKWPGLSYSILWYLLLSFFEYFRKA